MTDEHKTSDETPAASETSSQEEKTASEQSSDAETTSEPQEMPIETLMLETLKEVVDPELMVNIVDLGLIYEVAIEEKTADVTMTLTSPACPVGPQIMQQAKMVLERLDEVDEAKINLVMAPPWSPERMTDDARDVLGIF